MASLGASNKINVAIRVRPFSKRDHDLGTKSILSIDSNQATLHHPKGTKEPKGFAFDHCFDSHGADSDPAPDQGFDGEDQRQVFEKVGLDIVHNAFLGYNACVFAYGQTGSGKSYTMMGSPDNKGIIPRLCEELFARIDTSEASDGSATTKYKVEVSYIEIYNERVHDLLDPTGGAKKSLKVREHNLLGPYVENLTILAVSSFADISLLIREGNKSRTVAATNMNTESSRSHAVFSIRLTQSSLGTDGEVVTGEKVSKISLVDLAGSERVSKSGAAGERLKEGSNINKSLTTLGLVISTLADQSAGKVKSKFIPYRDSALTWLLKDNLGGNSLTTMLATLSPSSDNYEETLSTLRYADRAKRIVNHAVVNEDPRAKVIRELKEEVEALKAQLGRQMETSSLKERLKQSEDLMQELEMPWEAKLAISEKIQQERQKALENIGISVDDSGIKMQNDQYYLVNLNSDPSFTEMLVYYLKQPTVLVGRADAVPEQHIKLQGLGIMSHHCRIDIVAAVNDTDSDPGPELLPGVYITPIEGAPTCVNGVAIHSKTALHHGDRILWGYYHFFRLNCPSLPKNHASTTTSMTIDLSAYPELESGGEGTLPCDPYTTATQELAMNQPWFTRALEMNRSFPFSPTTGDRAPCHDANRETFGATSGTKLDMGHVGHKRPDSWDDSSIGSASLERVRKNNPLLTPPPAPFSLTNTCGSGYALKNGPTPGSGFKSENRERRAKEFRKSLVHLKEQIVHANLLVREANSIATELSVDVSYSAILQIPEDKLKVMNRSKENGDIFCQSAILVKRCNYPHYVWSMDKFENKIFEMRELYHESKNDPLQEVSREDLFYDVNYTNVLLGVANVYLECLRHDIKFDYKVPIINQQGQIAGKLTVSISRSEDGPTTLDGDKDINYSFASRRLAFGIPTRSSLVNSSSSSSLINAAAGGPLMSESVASTDSSGFCSASNASASLTPWQSLYAKIGIKEALELQITRQDSVYLQYSAPHYNVPHGSGGRADLSSGRRGVNALRESSAPAPYLVVEKKFRKKRKTIGPQNGVPDHGKGGGVDKRNSAEKSLAPTWINIARSVKFKHENVISIEYPENQVEVLNDLVLSIEVWCRRKLRKHTDTNVPSGHPVTCQPSSTATTQGGSVVPSLESVKKHLTFQQQPSSLVRRWQEVKKRLELWVTISELNEAGDYVTVEVTPPPPQPPHNACNPKRSSGCEHVVYPLANGTGGVYQVKQGRQRRIGVELKVAGGGSLPLMCESVRAMQIGSILVSSSNDVSNCGVACNASDRLLDNSDVDVLDSYQERGLELLRTKWSRAVEARRQYLDSHLQSFSQKSRRTKKDMLREQSLVDQWITLTEERNALLLPTSGSEIPGSPADREPPLGMEKHVPVIFLDTQLRDLGVEPGGASPPVVALPDTSLSDYASDDNNNSNDVCHYAVTFEDYPDTKVATIGTLSCLVGENEDGGHTSPLPYHTDAYFTLKIFREYRTPTNSLVAIASWDSSIHDSPHLNRCTSGEEKVFLILKILVKLSHPVPLFVWLRKRLCLSVGNHKISLGQKIRRKIGFTEPVIDACGVTYEIVSNIPEDSKDLEARENLAILAANAAAATTSTGAAGSWDGTGLPSQLERSSCSDNDEENSYQFKGMYDALRRRIGGDDGYIHTYVKSISALQSLLTFDKLRQEVVVREKLSTQSQGIHKTISVPDLNNVSPSNVRLASGPRQSENFQSLRKVTNRRTSGSHFTESYRGPKSRPALGNLLDTPVNFTKQRSLTPLTETSLYPVTAWTQRQGLTSNPLSGTVSHSISSHEINFCPSPTTPSEFNQWAATLDDEPHPSQQDNGISPLSAPNPPLFWNMKPLKTVLEEINSATGTAAPNQTN